MDRDVNELFGEIAASAQGYADALFEPLAKQITDDLNEKVVEGFSEGLDEEYVTDIVLPAFKRELFLDLGLKRREAADGWPSVYINNSIDRYNEGKAT